MQRNTYHIIISVFIKDIIEIEVMFLDILCEVNLVPKQIISVLGSLLELFHYYILCSTHLQNI